MTLTQRNLLIENYLPLAKKIAYSYCENRFSFWREEIKSAAYYGLLLAAEKYDETKSNFAHFAKIRINGEIKDFIRSELKIKHELVDFDKSFYCNSNLEEFLESFIFNLNSLEKEVFIDYYVKEKTMQEIAGDRNLSKSRISQIVSDMKNKLRR